MSPNIIPFKPRIANRLHAEVYVGGPEVLNILEREYGLQPIIKRNRRLFRWDIEDIDAALLRMKAGEHARY